LYITRREKGPKSECIGPLKFLIFYFFRHVRITDIQNKSSQHDMSTADERLRQFLNEGQAWEKKGTNIAGVFLVKLPTFRGTSPSLAIEVNPINASSSATKRRGVIIRSSSELEEIGRLLSNPKVAQLAKSIDKVNPSKESSTTRSGTDIFEI
jgi:hypothetical protein